MQATDVTYNRTDHMKNSVRGANKKKKNQTQHIQNSAQYTNVTTDLTEHIQKRA